MLSFGLLSFWQASFAQDKRPICGFEQIHEVQSAKNAEYKRIVEANEAAIQAQLLPTKIQILSVQKVAPHTKV